MTKTPDIALTERDRAILEHIHRHRLSTPEIMQRLFFAEQTVEAFKSWARRVRAGGLIRSAELIHPGCYYYLTTKAARHFGDTGRRAKPLGAYALARHYAMLAYCTSEGTRRKKLTPLEFRSLFPDLHDQSLPQDSYYLDGDSEPRRIGLLIVDQGTDARRVARKARYALANRHRLQPWREHVLHLPADDPSPSRFLITILTTKAQKRERIHEAIDETPIPIHCNVDVIPDLIHLV